MDNENELTIEELDSVLGGAPQKYIEELNDKKLEELKQMKEELISSKEFLENNKQIGRNR